MKLHLPKSLFIAVLAAIASELPTYAAQTGYGNGYNLSGDTYYIDGTATTDTVITHKEGSNATQINIASDVTDLIKVIGGANLTKDVTMVVCQNPWPNSPHNFDTLTLNSIETQNGAKVVLKVQDGISTVVGAVNGNGSIRGGEIEAGSQLTLGTSAGSTTLSGTFVNAGSLIINGAITVSADADLATGYGYTGLYSKDKSSANASASSNGFGQYSGVYDLIVESKEGSVATIEQNQITYKGEIKNLETLGDSSVGVMTSTETGFSDAYFVNESETLASSTSSSYVLADEATMTWSDELTDVNNISVKGNGTVVVTIGATTGHGNIINLGREFNGILEINKSADEGSGKVELHRYELGENATLRLVSGDYWGWGDTINTDIILAGKKADDFTFSHWGTVTVAGKITGSYLTSAGSLTLTHGENNIENVKLTGSTTLNVNNSMTFGTVVAPKLSIANNKELTIGYEAGASSSTISSLILNGLGKLNIREGAEVNVNGVTSGGDGLAKILVKNGKGDLNIRSGSYDGVVHNAGTINFVGENIQIGSDGSMAVRDDANRNRGIYAIDGNVNIGDGINVTKVTATRVEFGDTQNSEAGGTLNVKANATLVVTGSGGDKTTAAGSYGSASAIFGEWGASSTLNVQGTMLAKNATILNGDKKAIINIKNGGILAAAGIGRNGGQGVELTLEDGGLLILGSEGMQATSNMTALLHSGTIGISADSSTISKNLTIANGEEAAFDTQKYEWSDDGSSITRSDSGGSLTISGLISGEGKLVKKGEGALTLSGANTYSGGTKVEAGTLIVSGDGSLGSGDIDVTGGELQVSGVDAITAKNLNISNGTVVASYDGEGESVISHDTTVNVGTGGTLKLTGHDMLGWSAGAAPAKIVLGSDDASKKAKLDIQDTGACTFAPEVEMNGNAEITGTSISTYGGNTQIPNASTSDASDVVEGSRITVSKGENSIKVENLEIRRALELAIAKDAVLTINSVLFFNGNNDHTADRCITKSGDGTLVITNSANTWNKKLQVTGGTLRLEGEAKLLGSVTMASGTRLETGTGEIGSLDMAGGSTLDADTKVIVKGALTLGTGINLEGAIVNALYSGEKNVTLFTGTTSLSMGGATYDPSARVAYIPVDITRIFNIENMEEGRYNLYYEGGELIAGLTAAVPEPATATLSLLALAGLCARRRRKA